MPKKKRRLDTMIPCWCVFLAREVLGNDQRILQQAYQNTLQNRFPVRITDRRNGVGKLVFAPLGTEQMFDLIAPDLCLLGIPNDVCDKSLCKPGLRLRMARPMCDGRPFASSPFRCLASRGLPFRGFPVWWCGGPCILRSTWLDA